MRKPIKNNKAQIQKVGKPIVGYKQAERKYAQTLRRISQRMIADYKKQLEKATKESAAQIQMTLNGLDRKWRSAFIKIANKTTDKMINTVMKQSKASLADSIKEMTGLGIKVPMLPQESIDVISAATNYNIGLIKSIPKQFHNKIYSTVMNVVQTGDASEIKKTLSQINWKGANIDLIAQNQTRRLNAQLTVERMKSLNISDAKWRHSHGQGNPRPMHVALDGAIFNINNPPITNKKGERHLPGEEPGCACIMVPVITFNKD